MKTEAGPDLPPFSFNTWRCWHFNDVVTICSAGKQDCSDVSMRKCRQT